MRKIGLIAITILLLASCEKEKKYDPIQITSAVKNVTVNGASDGEITLTVIGGKEPYSYLWSNSATTKDLTELPVGKYSVVVTDATGDTASHSATVAEPAELTATFVKTNTTRLGNSDGTITLMISGGITPYTIDWSNGASESAIEDLESGTYTVDITDVNQALVHLEVYIANPITLTLAATNVTTFGGTNGSIALAVEGGVPPFTYLWNSGQTTEDISSIGAGIYSVTVTDAETLSANKTTQVFETYDKTTDAADIVNNVTRLNQSGIRIEYNSTVIYIDPINAGGYSDDADIILITHSHGDHLNPAVISTLSNAGTKVFATDECEASLTSVVGAGNLSIVAPNDEDTISNIRIQVVHAYNTNHITPHSVGYILTLNNVRVYHSGDTKKIPEMDSYNADIAFLPMGQTYTFATIEEAANAARATGAEVVVPIHYGLYEGKTSDAWTFKEILDGEIDVVVMPVNAQ